MKNEFLIRMDVPEDCLSWTDSPDYTHRLFHNPVTTLMKDEFDCLTFHSPSSEPIDYHEHSGGTETFFITQGKFLAYCQGKRFTMEAGDILHIMPWVGHGFTAIENESKLNIMFMGIDQFWSISTPSIRLRMKFPGQFEHSAFSEVYRRSNIGTEFRHVPAPKDAPREEIPQLRRSGVGLTEHEFPGVRMQLKVGRHETEGVKEIWELFLKKGFYAEWDDFVPDYHMFYVTGGKIHVTVKVAADETFEFDAEKENIIIIPPYNPFKIEVTEDATMFDMDCPCRLQDTCEEIEVYQYNNPNTILTAEKALEIGKPYGFNCTDIGYKA